MKCQRHGEGFEHGHESQREDASYLNCGNSQWMAVDVRLIFSKISYLHRLAGLSNAAHRRCAAYRGVPPQLLVCGRQVAMECSVAEAISFSEPHSAVARLAQPRRVCEHGLEHRLELTGRTGDDL